MNLREIREGVAGVLSTIDGVRVLDSIPEGLPASGVTTLVLAPGDAYVQYSEGAGFTNVNEVTLRVLVIPPQQSGGARIMNEIDALLSCGPTEPRSIRTTLGKDISAGGSSCAVSTISASLREITVNDLGVLAAEVTLRILARC